MLNDKITQDRRAFLKTASTLGTVAISGFPAILSAQTVSKAIKVGLVGCGGRGTAAASQALKADDYAELVAVADIDQTQIDGCLAELKKNERAADRVKVEKAKQFIGLDAYQKVIASGADVILLATPPGFRPVHLAASIAANKHVFCEKPVATDVPGIHSVLATVEAAKAKHLSLVAGFCWRYNNMIQDTFEQIQHGAIGRVVAYYGNFYTEPVKPMPPASARPAGMGDIEWQVRNWYNFVWLCGDSLVEQAVHTIDKVAWIMGDQPPVSCVAVGGRMTPNEGGNIYDHFEANYLYPNGVRAFVANRQIPGCYNENSDYILGSDGNCAITRKAPPHIEGKTRWDWSGQKYDMYQREHDVLFAAIRKGEPINDGKRLATSTQLAILGRLAAYSGQNVTWEQALNSTEKLVPDTLEWGARHEVPPMARPGVYKLA